jgi:hypothetical protein
MPLFKAVQGMCLLAWRRTHDQQLPPVYHHTTDSSPSYSALHRTSISARSARADEHKPPSTAAVQHNANLNPLCDFCCAKVTSLAIENDDRSCWTLITLQSAQNRQQFDVVGMVPMLNRSYVHVDVDLATHNTWSVVVIIWDHCTA